jgi:hypothetical protein
MRALGHYEVEIGSKAKKSREKQDDSDSSWLEIHELTPGEDGFLGSFTIANKLHGICILAGSRQGLASIIEDLEDQAEDSDDSGENDESHSAEAGSPNSGSDASEDGDEADRQSNEIELADERINRRARAFEKNSFRNPKFWLKYKAHVESDVQGTSSTASRALESDRGYIIFSDNACQTFDGTLSAASLGWDNVKFTGRKVRPRATPCPLTWTGFDELEIGGKAEPDEEQVH